MHDYVGAKMGSCRNQLTIYQRGLNEIGAFCSNKRMCLTLKDLCQTFSNINCFVGDAKQIVDDNPKQTRISKPNAS